MMMMDIKNYYIGTPLPRFEYMQMLLSRFPEEIVQLYNLLIPQVRPVKKYPISPWETIHLYLGDNALCATPHTVYMDVCNESLTATYQFKISNPSNKVLVNTN
jgi:hypothetical protein